MKKIAECFVMAVLLWALACSGTRADGLEVSINGQAVAGSHATLAAAVSASGVALADIKSLSVARGRWLGSDWEWLYTNRDAFTRLASLTTASKVSVAATPGVGNSEGPIFPKTIEWVAMEKLEKLGSNAFIGCQKLKGVLLNELTDVWNYAFESCTALKHIDLPRVKSIGNNAFHNCSSLRTINCAILTRVDYSFLECTSLSYAYLPGMERVPFGSFKGCSRLLSLCQRPRGLRGTSLHILKVALA